MNPPYGLKAFHIVSRTTAGFAGGYLFVWGLTTLGTMLATLTGMPYAEAQTLLYLLAFPVYVAVFCWAFASRNLSFVWLILAAGGTVMTALGWWLGKLQ